MKESHPEESILTGGQGRSGADLEAEGMALGWLALCVGLLAVGAVVAGLVMRGAGV